MVKFAPTTGSYFRTTPYAPPPPPRPRGIHHWAARADAVVVSFGTAPSTKSSHATALKALRFFLANEAHADMGDLELNPTLYFRAFAVWLNERSKETGPWHPLHPNSVPQYVGSARAAIENGGSPLDVNQKALKTLFRSLAIRNSAINGPPGPSSKQGLTIDMLRFIASHPAWKMVTDAVANGTKVTTSDADFNVCMAIAAAIIAYVTARRQSDVVTPVVAEFNPNLRCTTADVQASRDAIRLLYKPTKADKVGVAWRGWSPWIPAVPGDIACPHLAIAARFALLPRSNPEQALFCARTRGTVTPLSCAMLKALALDRALPMANPGVTSISPRHGAATALASSGFTEAQIQQWGHWRSTSWMSYASISDSAASRMVKAGLYR
jgi:hypothetical protein